MNEQRSSGSASSPATLTVHLQDAGSEAAEEGTKLMHEQGLAAATGRLSAALSMWNEAIGFQDRAALHESKAQVRSQSVLHPLLLAVGPHTHALHAGHAAAWADL